MTQPKITVVAFCYSWSKDMKLDAFQSSLLEAFSKRGVTVKVIMANQLAEYSQFGLNSAVSQDEIISFIKNQKADLVFSMNHGGLTRKLQDAITCPIVTWIVDAIPHMFHPDGHGKYNEMFNEKITVLCASTEIYSDLLRKSPGLAGRAFVVYPATNPEDFIGILTSKVHNISFVGSSLDISDSLKLITQEIENLQFIRSYAKAINLLTEEYNQDVEVLINDLGLRETILKYKWDVESFKMFIANIVSNNERFSAIEVLHDLGISLFGNYSWLNSLYQSPKILDSFMGHRKISSRSDLVEVYQSSKISINIPQLQVGASLSYRVFDIMASDSLLITKFHPQSDFFKIFGEDCPVPMYKDLNDLRNLCAFYLENEDLRVDIVKKCKLLVSKGFTFDDRVSEIFSRAGLTVSKSSIAGIISYLPRDTFHRNLSTEIQESVRSIAKRSIASLIKRFLPSSVRLRLLRFFQSIQD